MFYWNSPFTGFNWNSCFNWNNPFTCLTGISPLPVLLEYPLYLFYWYIPFTCFTGIAPLVVFTGTSPLPLSLLGYHVASVSSSLSQECLLRFLGGCLVGKDLLVVLEPALTSSESAIIWNTCLTTIVASSDL